MTFKTYSVLELAGILRRHGFIECDIPACNCCSWHHRYGLPERWQEIKDALRDADVLNNDVGNMPLKAIEKLTSQRDALAAKLEALQTEFTNNQIAHMRYEAELVQALLKIEKHPNANFNVAICEPNDPPIRDIVRSTIPEIVEQEREATCTSCASSAA